MAAPSTVYKDYMARRRKGGTPNVDIDLYVAKFLQNTTPPSGDNWGDGYFNAADIPPTAADWSAANAKIKAIFKVDGFLCVPKGTTENGFIGFCYSRTSGNGLYHKTERFSGVRVPTTGNANAELLNDGGLNRKPDPLIIEGDAAQVWWANLYSIKFSVRSAFYDGTSKIGFEYKINSGSWVVGAFTEVNQVAKNKTTYEFRKNDSLSTVTNTLYLRAFAENAEGKMYSQTYSSALGEKVYQLLALKVTNINDTTGTTTAIYMNETDYNNIANITTSSQSLGVEGFTSDLMTTEIADGYYKGLDPANPNRVYTYSGEFTKYDNATSTDSEGMPTGMPRLYINFAGALVGDVSFTGRITDAPSYPTAIAISVGATAIGGNATITGQGTGTPRNADIYLRRTNADNPSLNEDIYVATEYIEPNAVLYVNYTAVLSSAAAAYDKFSFIEII